MPRADWPSISECAAPLVSSLIADADALGIRVERARSGAVLVDGGILSQGGVEAGRRIAEICMGGLGRVSLTGAGVFRHWPTLISVSASNPVLACLGSQYAGWGLSGKEDEKFHALASGPGRALALREELFNQLDYADKANSACFVLEVGSLPPSSVLDKMAEACGLAHDRLTVICTPTQSSGGHRANRRASSGSGFAQGSRRRISVGSCCGRDWLSPLAAALAVVSHRDGPYQRCHPLRRARASLRYRRGRAGGRFGASFAEQGLARLWASISRSIRSLRQRFLQN